MKKIVFIFSLFVFISACSSATEETANTANSNVISTNSTNSNAVAGSNTNSQMIEKSGVDPNAFNQNSANAKIVTPDLSQQNITNTSRPAPDESEFVTKGRPDGSFAETRTFKNHPQLSKVEKITNGKNISTKVYLKNGKTIEAGNEKIPDIRNISAQNILTAVGIQPKVETPPASENQGKSKEESDSVKQP